MRAGTCAAGPERRIDLQQGASQLNGIVIREATSGDIPAVLKIYAQPTLDGDEWMRPDQAVQALQDFGRYPFYKIFVAEKDRQIVGTFTLLIMHNIAHMGRPSGLVEAVAVSPSLQRRGVGRAMLQFALEQCRAKGCYKMALSAAGQRRQAHAFYEALGFEKHGYSFVVPCSEAARSEGAADIVPDPRAGSSAEPMAAAAAFTLE